MKRIILCADDYSQSSHISKGILALLHEKRLSATTCITNLPDWPQQAQWLQSVAEHSDIGLHLNFTEGRPLTQSSTLAKNGRFHNLAKLLLLSHLHILKPWAIAAEINAQLDQFLKAMGKLPDFIDGHQHIHHLPMIAEVLIDIYKKRFRGRDCYLRSLARQTNIRQLSSKNSLLKKLVLEFTGSRRFHKQLIQSNIPHNTSFSGIYSFGDKIAYRRLFISFLQQISDGGLIMCHPGLKISKSFEVQNDPIAQSRALEFEYFTSEDFLRDCRDNQVKITRFKQTGLLD